MVKSENINALIDQIKNIEYRSNVDKFNIIRSVVSIYNNEGYGKTLRSILFPILERKEYFKDYIEILNSLLREIGLFQYIDTEKVQGYKDILTVNAFVAPKINDKEIIFHYPQAKVFYTIMSDKNVILSAPTSFGKSLIIDAIVATKKFKNIVIVVPTLALIDETRKRLSKFKSTYKIITHPSQEKLEQNIYILTQERVVIDSFIENVDFFIIDEFYKLYPNTYSDHDSRCDILNIAFYKLYKMCKHFYMLGPNIDGITQTVQQSISYVFMKEEFPTVGTNIYREYTNPTAESIYSIYSQTNAPTLVYCNTPKSATDMAKEILCYKKDINDNKIISGLCKWIAENFHPDWSLISCLKHGIGIHHARLPRALAQLIIELFNKGYLDILFCTSTIIEGVNTSAKNVILSENKIGRNDLDFFTFNNIVGRAGRMFKHFIGNIYIFSDIPETCSSVIDIPMISQTEETSLNILLSMDQKDLNELSQNKIINFFKSNDIISQDTINKSPYVEPFLQIKLAKGIEENALRWNRILCWTAFPTYEQLSHICELMFNYLNAKRLASHSVLSPEQLTYKINRLKSQDTTKDIILREIESCRKRHINFDVDNVITSHLNFIRMWACNHFPRLLMTISYIQEEIFKKLDLPYGNYSHYAQTVENLFFDPALICLEEYGIPLEISRKIENLIAHGGNLDQAIEALRILKYEDLPLNTIEKIFLRYIIKSI